MFPGFKNANIAGKTTIRKGLISPVKMLEG
jgi:hypothetical protein